MTIRRQPFRSRLRHVLFSALFALVSSGTEQRLDTFVDLLSPPDAVPERPLPADEGDDDADLVPAPEADLPDPRS